MAATHEAPVRSGGSRTSGVGPIWAITEVLLGVLGVTCAVMGIVILVGSDDQWVGFGGDWMWRVGDIPEAAGYGLLIGGAVLLLVMVALLVSGRSRAEGRVEQRDRPLADLGVHALVFAIVNGFLWVQDIATGGGPEYAYWTTIPWGIGLAAHALAYLSSRREPHEPRGA